jgi:hypothetical protein
VELDVADSSQSCPCCGRAFERISDYPKVRILSFERLPIPEAIDDMSDAAAQKSLEWHRSHPTDTDWSRRGINLTPEIDRACRTSQVQEYLGQLESFVGREMEPSKLLPQLPVDRVFKAAYPVGDTPIFLSLTEGERTTEGKRTAEVQALCRGPSLGSAGGPTLMHLGPIARLTYEGLLMTAGQVVRG